MLRLPYLALSGVFAFSGYCQRAAPCAAQKLIAAVQGAQWYSLTRPLSRRLRRT